jgi:hypothetical protein
MTTGRLHLELRTKDGATVAVRRGTNSVMKGGAALLADLFRGGGMPINRMGVGVSDAPETDAFGTSTLTNPTDPNDATRLKGDTEVAIPSDAFIVKADETHRLVQVHVHATLPEDAAVGSVREAGLLARKDDETATLYNRVVFAPITKGDDHELTLFWEISFPYGDLQWMH